MLKKYLAEHLTHNKAIDHALSFPFDKEGVMEFDFLLSLSMRGNEKILSTEEKELSPLHNFF